MLNSDIELYFNKNLKKKDIEKELKDIKGKIIKDMGDSEEIIDGEYKVTYKPSYSYTVDEDALVGKIQEYADSLDDPNLAQKIVDCLEVKMVVDEEKLESLIYNGLVPEDIGKDCTTTKEIYRFTVSKVKKSK